MSHTPLVVGNWKMNGSLLSVREWAKKFGALAQEKAPAADCGLCVPAVFLQELVKDAASDAKNLTCGAEDVSVQPSSGAFTGEVSAAMLADAGAFWCIVGHSERRTIFGETDADTALKVKNLAEIGIKPILCVGETLAERNAGETASVVLRQLEAVLSAAGIAALSGGAVAYEPLWAIGTGVTATAEQIEEVHAVLREALDKADSEASGTIRILYGGSVKPANAAGILALPHVNGALVGGAALDAESFYRICAAAVQHR